jgi:hypothetical protein
LTKALLRFVLLALFFAPAAFAQQTTPWEVFGGFSLQRAAVREYFKATPIIYTFRERYINLPGWEVSLTENANKWFGGTLQSSGHYSTDVAQGTRNRQRNIAILYGPRFLYPGGWFRPYGHVLFGAAHASVSVSPGPHATETRFAVAGGAGIDLKFGRVGIRVLEVQYSPKNEIATKPNQLQASTGAVFYIGTPK